MRLAAFPLIVIATPAAAHHEMVVAASMVPLMGGIATIAVAALAALRKSVRKR
jgi:hypothetical protein